MDGYDEVSLTGPFKWISNDQESLLTPSEIGMKTVQPEDLAGGNTIEEAAKIFWDVINGNGTDAQNQVVVANSGFALQCARPEWTLAKAFDEANESLMQGRALRSFKNLIGDKIINV